MAEVPPLAITMNDGRWTIADHSDKHTPSALLPSRKRQRFDKDPFLLRTRIYVSSKSRFEIIEHFTLTIR